MPSGPGSVPVTQVPKEEVDRKPIGGTKTEKDILARTVEQLRSRVVHKQVASGREFKGCPFNSKPKLIHFKASRGPAGGEGARGPGRLRGVWLLSVLLQRERGQASVCAGEGLGAPGGTQPWALRCPAATQAPPGVPRKLLPALTQASPAPPPCSAGHRGAAVGGGTSPHCWLQSPRREGNAPCPQDFDIGKVYKKRTTLINATYTINYCKLEGVDEHLRDFIHIA